MSNKIGNSSPVNTNGITYTTTTTTVPANVFLSVPSTSGQLWRFSLGANNTLLTKQNIILNSDFIVNNNSVTFTNSPNGDEDTVLKDIFYLVKSGSLVPIGTATDGINSVKYACTGAPFIIVNGSSPISFQSYCKSANINVNQNLVTNPLTSTMSTTFNNINSYILDVYSGKSTFSEMGLLNYLTDSNGPNPIKIANISIRKEYVSNTIYGKTQPVEVLAGYGSAGSLTTLQFNCNTGSWYNFDPCYSWISSSLSGGSDVNNFMSNLIPKCNISFSYTQTDLGSGTQADSNIGLVVGNASVGGSDAGLQNFFINSTVSTYGIDKVGNKIMEILFAYNGSTCPTAQGWTLELPLNYYDWQNEQVSNESAYSLYLQSNSGYLNTGKSFFQSYDYNDNVVPAFYCFGLDPRKNYNIWTQTANSVLIYTQGTIQLGSQGTTSSATDWSSDQVISTMPEGSYQSFSNYWGLTIPLRNQFPIIGFQQVMANTWGGENWGLEFEVNNSTRYEYTIPVYYIQISDLNKPAVQSELTSPTDIIDKMIKYYDNLSLTLSSFLLGKHNAKTLQLPDESTLLNSYTIVASGSNQTFSSTVLAQCYGLIYLTAVKNNQGINLLTELFNGYPFSSIPKYAYSIMNQISNSFNINSMLSSDQLNDIIYAFYTMSSLTSVTSTSDNFSDLNPSILKSAMNQVDGGLALMSFSKEVLKFLSSLSNVSSSQSLSALKGQWMSITSNWNKSGLSAIVKDDAYCYHASSNDIISSVSTELGELNDLVAKNLTLEGNKSNLKVEFKQIISNHHLQRCNALSAIISQLSDDFLISNPWKEIGKATLGLVTSIGEVSFSIVKFMLNITANIFTGISNFVSVGSIIEDIFNDTSIILTNPTPNYPDIFNDLSNSIIFDSNKGFKYNPFLFDPFRGSISNSYYTVKQQDNGLVSLLLNNTVCYSDLVPNSITRYIINTPIGKASVYIDLVNYLNNDGQVVPSLNGQYNIIVWMIDPSTRPDGKVDSLKTLYRQAQLMKYSLLMLNPEIELPNAFSTFFSNPQASNYTNHMSVGEITAIDSASAAVAADYLSKAVIDGFHFQADSAIGYGIYAAENLDMLVEATLQYEKDSASNVSNAFVSSGIEDINFLTLSLNPVSFLSSKFVIKSFPSIIENNSVTSSSVATPTYSPDIQDILSLIAIDVGKFAASNYIQHKLYKKLTNHISKQMERDAKTSKLSIPISSSTGDSSATSASSIKSASVKMLLNKYHRDKNKKARCNALNNQSTSLNDSISATGNAITNAVGQTAKSLSDDIASISNIWGVS